MSRISSIPREDFTDAQRKFFENLTGGRRGKGVPIESFFSTDGRLRGPFGPWIHSPPLGDATQRLGEAVRFESTLPPRYRELAILVVATHWDAAYELFIHEKIARSEGLEDDLIESLKAGRRPGFHQAADALVFDFSRAVIAERKVPERLYREAVSLLGEKGVVELAILLGYYMLVSITLNVFEIPAPARG